MRQVKSVCKGVESKSVNRQLENWSVTQKGGESKMKSKERKHKVLTWVHGQQDGGG